MLIAVNAGNRHVQLGGYEEDARVFRRFHRDRAQIHGGWTMPAGCSRCSACTAWMPAASAGAAVGSVVPGLAAVLRDALHLLGVKDVILVSSGVKTGLNIRSEQPQQVGADRVAAAVAAKARGRLPCVVVSLGTATTFTVLDQGRARSPARRSPQACGISVEALRAQAAQLPAVALEDRDEGVLARNTVDAMRVGALYGAAAMVDGMIGRFAAALGQQPQVIVTGSHAPLVMHFLQAPYEHDPCLALDGLHLIWKKNRPDR